MNSYFATKFGNVVITERPLSPIRELSKVRGGARFTAVSLAVLLSGVFGVSSVGARTVMRARSTGKGVVCTLVGAHDSQSGVDALRFLVPLGWKSTQKAFWAGQGKFIASIIVTSPDGKCRVSFSSLPITYNESPYGKKVGMRFNGAADLLNFQLGNLARAINMEDATVVNTSTVDLPRNQVDAVEANSYTHQGGNFFKQLSTLSATGTNDGTEEKIFIGAIMSGGNMNLYGKFHMGNYSVLPMILTMVPANADSHLQTEVRVVASSFAFTPEFNKYCASVVAGVNEASRAKINDPSRHEKLMAQFKDQEGAKDKQTHEFLNYIRDRDDFVRSDGKVVNLPNYNVAWYDGQGHYAVSDDKTFNPTGSSATADWQKLKRKRD